MPDKEKQVKNTLVYLLPIITSNVFPFITIPVFTRILTKNDYGVLALTLVYAVFVTGLANFGMTAAYDRNYFQHRADPLHTAQLLYSILLFVLANFVVFACLTYVFRGNLSRLIIGCSDHGDILFFAFCAQFFSSINYYYLTYFRNSEIAKDFATYTIAAALINFVISLLLVAYLRIGVIGIIYAQLCSGVVIFGVLSCKFQATLPLSLSDS